MVRSCSPNCHNQVVALRYIYVIRGMPHVGCPTAMVNELLLYNFTFMYPTCICTTLWYTGDVTIEIEFNSINFLVL